MVDRGGVRGAIAVSQLLVAALIAVVGAGVGVALDAAGVVGGGDETVVVGLDAVVTYDCPDGVEVGELHRGDRVFATGRDDSGDWAEVRDPSDLSSRVWLPASHLVPDADLSDLDVTPCAIETAFGTTTTSPAVTTTSPESGGPAADTTGPTITGVSASPASIETLAVDGTAACAVNTSIVTVTASDPSGISSVTVTWTAGSASGTAVPQGGGHRVGPIPYQSGNPIDQPVVLSITVRDGAGNATSAPNTSALRYSFCFT